MKLCIGKNKMLNPSPSQVQQELQRDYDIAAFELDNGDAASCALVKNGEYAVIKISPSQETCKRLERPMSKVEVDAFVMSHINGDIITEDQSEWSTEKYKPLNTKVTLTIFLMIVAAAIATGWLIYQTS